MSKLTPGKEFERKFWVLKDRLPKMDLAQANVRHIVQGYLAIMPTQVRIRIEGGKAVLELKGANNMESDPQKLELAFAEGALDRFRVGDLVRKDRHELPARFNGLVWEIDFFKGANAPLKIVEIETPAADTPLDRALFPAWVGDEITGDPAFEPLTKNKNLAIKPFRAWTKRHQALAERHMRERFR